MPKEKFLDAVLDRKGRIFVDFTASWCPPCKAFSPTVEKLIQVGIPVYKLDVDVEPHLAAEFGVMSVPTMVLFENGQPVGSYAGVKTYDDLKKIFEE